MNYQFHNHFTKTYQKLTKKLRDTVDAKLFLFAKDPYSPSLNNHILIGKYKDYRSINITGDYRAIYKEISKDKVIFVKLGSHSELYG